LRPLLFSLLLLNLLLPRSKLCRRVSVIFGLVFGIDVTEPELIRHAVHTPDNVAGGGLCFLGHLTDAQPADIVVAAGAGQNVIKVA
jgi:hypothetical protein